MARRAFVDGRWVDAPDAPQLPSPAQPPAAQPPAAPPAGAASLNHASAVISGLQDRFGPQPLVAENSSFSAQETPQLQQTAANLTATPAARQGGVVMGDAELNQRRRSAFLDASDSMSGLKAVRGLLGEQAQARGADLAGGGSIPSIKFLEAQLAKNPAKTQATKTADLSQADQAVWGKMAFDNQPIGQVIQGAGGAVNEAPATGTPALEGGGLSPSQIAGQSFAAATPELAPQAAIPSGAPRAAVNAYMQTALKGKLQAGQQPLDQIAQWQLTPQPITAPRTDPGREAKLAAFAAQRETPPTTEGEALLAAGASNPFGTRGGLFKPGNTVNLGFADPSKLPPLNSTGHYSGANPGNYQRLF